MVQLTIYDQFMTCVLVPFATYSPSPSVRLVENSVSPVSTRTEDVGHERGDNTFPTPYSSLNFLSIVPGGLQKQLMAHQRRCKSHLFSSLLLGLLPAISPLQEYFWVSTEVKGTSSLCVRF